MKTQNALKHNIIMMQKNSQNRQFEDVCISEIFKTF